MKNSVGVSCAILMQFAAGAAATDVVEKYNRMNVLDKQTARVAADQKLSDASSDVGKIFR